jgi:hypothetical protein
MLRGGSVGRANTLASGIDHPYLPAFCSPVFDVPTSDTGDKKDALGQSHAIWRSLK